MRNGSLKWKLEFKSDGKKNFVIKQAFKNI